MNTAEWQQVVQELREALLSGRDLPALAKLDQLAAMDPDNPAVAVERARLLLTQGDARGAFAEARRAVDLSPAHPCAWFVRSLAEWRLERLTGAQKAFERCLALSEFPGAGENRSVYLANYALFMAQNRGPRLAEEAARRALEADAEAPEGWAALGLAQLRQRRLPEAEESFGRGLALHPTHVVLQTCMVAILRQTGRHADADALLHVMQDDPDAAPLVEEEQSAARVRSAYKQALERDAVQEELFGRTSFGAWLDRVGTLLVVLAAIPCAALIVWRLTGGRDLRSALPYLGILLCVLVGGWALSRWWRGR